MSIDRLIKISERILARLRKTIWYPMPFTMGAIQRDVEGVPKTCPGCR